MQQQRRSFSLDVVLNKAPPPPPQTPTTISRHATITKTLNGLGMFADVLAAKKTGGCRSCGFAK